MIDEFKETEHSFEESIQVKTELENLSYTFLKFSYIE